MWKEALIAQFDVLSQHFCGETEIKPQENWFRIVSLWVQIWIQTSRIQSRSADTSTVKFGPDFYHLSHWYTWQDLLVRYTV